MPDSEQLRKKIVALLSGGVREGVFSGAAAAVAWGAPGERQELDVTAGATAGSGSPPIDTRTCFDLASLTKPLATGLTILCLINDGALALETPLPFLLSGDVPADKQGITLRHLLGHASGLPAHRPYFESLVKMPADERWAALRRWILAEPLLSAPGGRTLYSDLGFLLLGMIVAERSGRGLARMAAERVLRPLGLEEEIFFQPLWEEEKEPSTRLRGRVFAATERCPWRGRLLSGEVHDDNAHALGGVAGHAGLFGTAGGMLALVRHLLDVRQGRAVHPGYRPEDLRVFLSTRSVQGSSWGLAFDTPSPVGSSAGRHFSETSFGHLGFTGTSFWVDPEKELAVVLLTNRVHPTRDNGRIKAFRPLFHNAVVETLFF
ncbi:MAG: serine hydrolase [Desulfobacteraceae bacterium]|nr:serine hydrolase [Desulfobacteraceae bacterium]